jgi:hypothetical protein
MKLKEFDKENLQAIRNDVNSALKAVEERYGVAFDIGRITYTSATIRTKLSGTIVGAVSGASNSVEAQLIIGLKSYGYIYGVSEKDAKKVFSANGNQYVFMGIKASSKKYPFVVKRVSDGKMFKFPSYFSAQIKASKEFAR